MESRKAFLAARGTSMRQQTPAAERCHSCGGPVKGQEVFMGSHASLTDCIAHFRLQNASLAALCRHVLDIIEPDLAPSPQRDLFARMRQELERMEQGHLWG